MGRHHLDHWARAPHRREGSRLHMQAATVFEHGVHPCRLDTPRADRLTPDMDSVKDVGTNQRGKPF